MRACKKLCAVIASFYTFLSFSQLLLFTVSAELFGVSPTVPIVNTVKEHAALWCRHVADIRVVGKRAGSHAGWAAARCRKAAVCCGHLSDHQRHVLHVVSWHLHSSLNKVRAHCYYPYHPMVQAITHVCCVISNAQITSLFSCLVSKRAHDAQ